MALNLHTMAGIEKDTHNAFGMTNLGMMLENGRGTEKDVGQAVELYRKAVGPNHSTEMVALGWLYGNGKAVKRDPARRRGSIASLRSSASRKGCTTLPVSWRRVVGQHRHRGGGALGDQGDNNALTIEQMRTNGAA